MSPDTLFPTVVKHLASALKMCVDIYFPQNSGGSTASATTTPASTATVEAAGDESVSSYRLEILQQIQTKASFPFFAITT